MKTSLDISRDGAETGALLQRYLEERRVYDSRADAVVCYGYPHGRRTHMINGHRKGQGKIDNMRLMEGAGCRVVPWFSSDNIPPPASIRFPLLARKAHGMGGTDIATVFQFEEIPWRIAAGWSWFSSYVPVATEYRVWVFRGQHLDTYEKRMRRPSDYKFIGRNFRNGFDFELVPEGRNDTTKEAIKAIKGLGLDFAAIDMLFGLDRKIYILEANTAPGVLKSDAHATLGKLADRITDWVHEGYPTWSH